MKVLFGYLCVLFILVIFLGGCSKQEKVEPEKEKVFIRVKNTSTYDYLNVQVIAISPDYFQYSGELNTGEVSDYLSFDSAYAKFDIDIQLHPSRWIGVLYPHADNDETLNPGKYLIEVEVFKDPHFSIRTKLIEE